MIKCRYLKQRHCPNRDSCKYYINEIHVGYKVGVRACKGTEKDWNILSGHGCYKETEESKQDKIDKQEMEDRNKQPSPYSEP